VTTPCIVSTLWIFVFAGPPGKAQTCTNLPLRKSWILAHLRGRAKPLEKCLPDQCCIPLFSAPGPNAPSPTSSSSSSCSSAPLCSHMRHRWLTVDNGLDHIVYSSPVRTGVRSAAAQHRKHARTSAGSCSASNRRYERMSVTMRKNTLPCVVHTLPSSHHTLPSIERMSVTMLGRVWTTMLGRVYTLPCVVQTLPSSHEHASPCLPDSHTRLSYPFCHRAICSLRQDCVAPCKSAFFKDE